ncbi:MAG: hypothetical protein LBC63_03075 [Holophagales bacterium]|jgi:hypothetical protein|nr:hypothetical protein [Holophagales bacterium]
MKHGFYVYIETITEWQGRRTAQQAIDYITDDHDSKRLANINEEMIAYICRLDPGYKTEHEGGKVPLVGHGAVKDIADFEVLNWEFNQSTIPNDVRGTKGYKSITLTLPKEMTLLCETSKSKARDAITRAIEPTLEESYPNKKLVAVSAMHTRNEAGDPHVNVHLLVAKTVQDKTTGQLHSINNNDKYGDLGSKEEARMKRAWKREITKELEKEFNVEIRFTKKGKCKISTPDGLKIHSLTLPTLSEKQRAWEIANGPEIDTWNGLADNFKINLMDAKILEVARKVPFTRGNFLAVFPSFEKHYVIDKRIETLKKHKYLDEDLKPTEAFIRHAKAKFGHRPDFKQIKEDVDNILGKMIEKAKDENPESLEELVAKIFTTPLQVAMESYARIAERIERLDPTPTASKMIEARWVDSRKQITPELAQWSETVHEHAKVIKETKEKSENLPSAIKKQFLENRDFIATNLRKRATKELFKAAKSLRNPLLQEHNTLLSSLVEDRNLHKDMQTKIEKLTKRRDQDLDFAGDWQKPYITKHYQVQITELKRTSEKLGSEITRKTARALRIEKIILEKFKKFTKTDNRHGNLYLPPEIAQRMYDQIFKAKSSLKDYLSGKSDNLSQDCIWVRRGFKVMEILGYKEVETLKPIMVAGLEQRLMQENAQRKTPQYMALATAKAKEIGKVLYAAEQLFTFNKPNLPRLLAGTSVEREVSLMIARLTALGIEAPDLSNINPSTFTAICKSDERLLRLTTEGSAFMMDWQYKDNKTYEIALERFTSPQLGKSTAKVVSQPKTQEMDKSHT